MRAAVMRCIRAARMVAAHKKERRQRFSTTEQMLPPLPYAVQRAVRQEGATSPICF